jgi:hypothetical protein
MLLPNFIESDQLLVFAGCTMSYWNVPLIWISVVDHEIYFLEAIVNAVILFKANLEYVRILQIYSIPVKMVQAKPFVGLLWLYHDVSCVDL